MDTQVKYRIGWVSASFIVGIAVVADLLQVLLSLTLVLSPADDIVTVVGEGFIFFYFMACRAFLFKGKRVFGRTMGFLVTTIIEMVPIVDALPTLTFDTIYNVHSIRKEDREAFKEKQATVAAEAAAQQAQEEEAMARAYIQAANDNEEYAEEYAEAA